MSARTEELTVWMRRSCGDWCQRLHEHTHAPVHRPCAGEENQVALSMSTAHGGGENLGPHMTAAVARLEQEPREYEPHIVLSLPTEVENLTLREASSLSSVLARLVHEATEAAKEVDRW